VSKTVGFVILGLALLVGATSSADPPSPATTMMEQAVAQLEKDRLRGDPSDRPMIIGSTGSLVPSDASKLSTVSVDCGLTPARTVNGRLHVRCTIATSTVVAEDATPIEDEIQDLQTMSGKALDEACSYLAGKPMRPESDPAGYHTSSKMWSNVLALRLEDARRDQTEAQKALLAGVIQACQSHDKDRFLQTYVTFLRQVAERTCHLQSGSDTEEFEKVDADTWVARPRPSVCGESSVMTLFRAPGSGLRWNYKSVDAYPTPAPAPLCTTLAGTTMVQEFRLSNQRLRDSGCRYFDL
jgi:hypothetical protein